MKKIALTAAGSSRRAITRSWYADFLHVGAVSSR